MPTGVSMKAVVLAFSVVAIMQHAVCSVAAASKFGTNNYVEYVPGDLPIVLTVPHGGSLKPANITDRTAGCGSPCVYAACNTPNTSTCPIRTLSDTNTDDVATEMAAALERLTSRRPHVVFVHLHRSKLDANREADEAAQGDADALQAYNEYFAFVDEAVASVQAGCGFGLVVDVHGQAHSHQNIELGYTISGSTLDKSDTELNKVSLSSLQSLVGRENFTLADIIRGPNALGTSLATRYGVVPSSTLPGPQGSSYYSGGFTTKRYGRATNGTGDGIDAVQFELNSNLRFSGNLTEFGDVSASAFKTFFDAFYSVQLGSGDGCPQKSTPSCTANKAIPGAYFHDGSVWDDACRASLHGSCPPSESKDVLSHGGSTFYRRLPSAQQNMGPVC